MLEEFIGCQTDILDDLPEEIRGDVAAGVERNRRNPAVCMTKLLVGATLTNL